MGVGLEPEAERRGQKREVTFGHGQEAMPRRVGIGRDQQAGAGGADNADAAAAPIESPAAALLGEVAQQHDGTARLLGQLREAVQAAAHVLIAAAIDALGQKSDKRIENE